MMKTQIGLGVLSIPAVFDTLGIVPGVICLCAVSAITTWSDYIVGVFKLRHPEVYSIDDAGFLMFGRIGREFLGIAFCLCKPSILGQNSTLTSSRLHLCGRIRNVRHLYRGELFVSSWRMHCYIRRCRRYHRFLIRQHSHTGPHKFPCVAWADLHSCF